MIAMSELRALPLAERLRLIEALWDSIAEEQVSLPVSPAVVRELRARKARFLANPSPGKSWEQVKETARAGRASKHLFSS